MTGSLFLFSLLLVLSVSSFFIEKSRAKKDMESFLYMKELVDNAKNDASQVTGLASTPIE